MSNIIKNRLTNMCTVRHIKTAHVANLTDKDIQNMMFFAIREIN